MENFVKAFTAYARSRGLNRLEFYAEERQQRSLHVYHGALESLETSRLQRGFIEAETEGFYGSLFVEDLSESLFPEHVRLLKESALARKRPFAPYAFPELPEETQPGEPAILPADTLAEKLLEAEKAAYAAHSAVKEVQGCSYWEERKKLLLLNGEGRCLKDSTAAAGFYMSLEAMEGNTVQMGRCTVPFLPGALPDMRTLARQAALDAAAMLNAGSYTTGRHRVLLSARVVCELLNAFAPAFAARQVQSHTSALEGKLGERIAAESVVLRELPLMEKGLCRRRFDDERTPTREKTLIAGGRLQSYLYNRESAAQAGCPSTGNGFIQEFGSEAATGFTNMVLEAGADTTGALLARLGRGLYITEVNGVFAGANAATGNFSLISAGYAVEDGKPVRGVSQITIAGSFSELLQNVEALGSELIWMRGNEGYIQAPALLISALAVAGQEE